MREKLKTISKSVQNLPEEHCSLPAIHTRCCVGGTAKILQNGLHAGVDRELGFGKHLILLSFYVGSFLTQLSAIGNKIV